MQKAQAIRGMMALKMVRFPEYAVWYQPMVNELLRFRGEGDAQDDFVDTLGHVGRGLEGMLRGRRESSNENAAPKFGTMGWLQAEIAANKAREARIAARNGW